MFIKNTRSPIQQVSCSKRLLLQELVSEHVTLVLNAHVPVVTGIPVHVEQLFKLEELKNYCIEIKAVANTFNKTIRASIAEAIDEG